MGLRKFTRKWLEYKIVQAAERFPKRVGPIGWGSAWSGRCMLGFIAQEASEINAYRQVNEKFMDFITRDSLNSFTDKVIALNDSKMPWGEIPLKLGLVPGEMKVAKTRKVAVKAKAKVKREVLV